MLLADALAAPIRQHLARCHALLRAGCGNGAAKYASKRPEALSDTGPAAIKTIAYLQLVNLTTDGLHRLKVSKAELIACPPSDYLDTARWAEALHRE